MLKRDEYFVSVHIVYHNIFILMALILISYSNGLKSVWILLPNFLIPSDR